MITKKRKHYFPLIIIACITNLTILVLKNEIPSSVTEFAGFLGQVFGISIIPLVFMRFVNNKSGWVVFIFLFIGYSQGELNWLSYNRISTSKNNVIIEFQSKGCEYSVYFPAKPIVKNYSHPQISDYEEALWIAQTSESSTMLRTECIQIPNLEEIITKRGAKEFILNQLKIYSQNNGLSSSEYNYKKSELGHTGLIRGIKRIEGTSVTVKIKVVAGTNSLISLYAGGKSSDFPQREVSHFLSSVKRANQQR